MAVAILALLPTAGSGCKEARTLEGPGPQPQGVVRPIEVPREVVSYIGLRNPESAIDDLLALIRPFYAVPLDRQGILDLLAQKAKLPREMVGAVDTSGTFWLVLLDGKQLGERESLVLAFPLRSRQGFEAFLEKRMQRAGSEGELTLYKPKPGEVGLQETRLVIQDKYVLAPSSKKALDRAGLFIRQNLLERPPSYDLTVNVMVQHVLQSSGTDVNQSVSRILKSMKTNVPAARGPIDREQLAIATEEALRHYAELIKSMRSLIITADVDPRQVTLSVRGDALPGGLLHRVIQRQRPGPVLGDAILPASSWLVVANRGNPEAVAERQKSLASTLRLVFKGASPEYGPRLQSALTELSASFTGDLSIALHKAKGGSGVALSAVARFTEAKRARNALSTLVEAGSAWLNAVMKEEGAPAPRGFALEKQPFQHRSGQGLLLQLRIPYPEAHSQQLTQLFGPSIDLGWAFVKDTGVLAAGKEARAQLEELTEGLEAGKVAGALADYPAFRRARNASPSRTGLVYVSLLGLVRWLQGAGFDEAETIAAALKGKEVSSCPSLDFGVNATRSQLDVSLRVPADHFQVFKPIFDEMSKKSSRGSVHGSRPRWAETP